MHSDLYGFQYAVLIACGRAWPYPSGAQVVDAQNRAHDCLGGIVVDQDTCLHGSLSTGSVEYTDMGAARLTPCYFGVRDLAGVVLGGIGVDGGVEVEQALD